MFRRKSVISHAILYLTAALSCFCIPDGFNQKYLDVYAGDIFERGEKLYSHGNEELIIRDFFNDKRNGFFVDVGACFYESANNTYYLEKNLGWSGIAVDALAEYAIGYIENRPNTRFFNFIVTDHSWEIEPFYRATGATPISSTDTEQILEHAEYNKLSKDYQVIYIPTITLTELLEKNGIKKIDFLSMDIEGGEEKALEGFDIERFKPELVCVENNRKSQGMHDYFKRHNYEPIDEYRQYDTANVYYKPKK